MARKNNIKKVPEKSRTFNAPQLEQQISVEQHKQFPKQSYIPIGNCRYIEDYIGIRLNGSDKKESEFYKILIVDVEKCFDEPLTVAFIYHIPNRNIEVSEPIKAGNVRASKSQRALNIKFNNGKIITISKTTLTKILNNIYVSGIVYERIMES